MAPSREDVIWLAGLMEGEGCFTWCSSLTVTLAMCDEDVVRRAARIMGARSVRYRKRNPDRETQRPTFEFALTSARAAGWMMMLYPFMGERRQRRIRELLARWRQGRRHIRKDWRQPTTTTKEQAAA